MTEYLALGDEGLIITFQVTSKYSYKQPPNLLVSVASCSCLTSTLTHLTALTTKTSHTLLLPLLTHTCVNIKKKSDCVLLLNAVSSEGSSLEGVSAVDKTDELGRNEFLVLNHSLEGLNGGGSLNVVSGVVY
jgi:hypothetical protein